MSLTTSYKLFKQPSSDKIYLILHGSNGNINEPFMSSIFDQVSQTKSGDVLSLNLPYCQRGEDTSSGDELIEEVNFLNQVWQHFNLDSYKDIVLIGKSLGGIVFSFWQTNNPKANVKKLIALGLVINEYKLKGIKDLDLVVIQGEQDRFGGHDAVEEYLQSNNVKGAKILSIPGANHSFKNTSGEPEYQDLAIKTLIQNL